LWDGVSAYQTEAQARKKARKIPVLGAFIAVVQVPENGPITYERTLKSSGHHTLRGDAQTMLDCVESYVPVGEEE
jgi:hypothetical protein